MYLTSMNSFDIIPDPSLVQVYHYATNAKVIHSVLVENYAHEVTNGSVVPILIV